MKKKSELLAPAGSVDAFHACVDAGADAIYCGVGEFNARLRAKNISMKQLSYLLPYAHSKNTKVYITLNTLVKNQELENLINTLYQLNEMGVDAVIIQDFGIIPICRTNFPQLELHGSTQMVIHNSAGARVAEKWGLKRIILSRELSFQEISDVKKNSNVEIETFIHGALCYSVSGLCLASSYLGGMSGNRGRCTQVCRRKFSCSSDKGFYFSPKDLSAIDHILKLNDLGIESLKIEGRMKSAEYVYRVVSAYRKLLDHGKVTEELRYELENDLGRRKSPFFLGGDAKGLITPADGGGTGIRCGKILGKIDEKIIIGKGKQVNTGDRIRIQGKKGFEGISGKIINAVEVDKGIELETNIKEKIFVGDEVFIVGNSILSKKLEKKENIDIKPVKYGRCNFTGKLLKKLRINPVRTNEKKKLFLKIDDMEWFYHLKKIKYDYIILELEINEFDKFVKKSKIINEFKNKLIISIPPVIFNYAYEEWKNLIGRLKRLNIDKWMIQNISHFDLVEGDGEIYADTFLWCINSSTVKWLKEKKVKKFTYSYEDDTLNIRRFPHEDGMIYIFGQIPLFISRVKPGVVDEQIIDSKNDSFYTIKKHNLYYTYAEKPYCLFSKKPSLEKLGINNHIIDLSEMRIDIKLLKTIISSYNSSKKIPGTTMFNFKKGLK